MDQSAFFTLCPRLQQGIVSTLGWSSLRPVQELTIRAVLTGRNCVVLAPTAGGKTEAAFFPILDILYQEHLAPVSALYVSPIRALLNNQEPRLAQLTSLVGLTAFKWHGDVGQGERARFLADPAHILMTTPESLEVMLISSRIDKARLFSNLRFAVVDEIHSFAAGDRGAHLMAVLERLARYTSQDVQRIGLSATVGDPENIASWMQGSSGRPSMVVDPGSEPKPRLIRVDVYNDEDELARLAAPLVKGRKTLFFVEGRRLAEGVRQALGEATDVTYVHHSSVGRELREEAEQAFVSGRGSQCIVCTSTMELGIDIGDLDAVLQLDAPATVSSMMQRMGRTGRRPGSQVELAFMCGDKMALLRATALVSLARQGWIEPVAPSEFAVHVLAQQILAQALQFYGVRKSQVVQAAEYVRSFARIAPDDLTSMLTYMVQTGVLSAAEGLLVLGAAGEKRYGRKNFLDLYSVFETPEEVRVVTPDRRVIGTLESWFVQQVADGEAFAFVLAGRMWLVQHLDLENAEMVVVPAPKGAIPRWGGKGTLLSRRVAEEMRSVLAADVAFPFLTKRAFGWLASLRGEWRGILDRGRLPICRTGQEWGIYTFAGDRINLLLSRALSSLLDCSAVGDSLGIRLKMTKGQEIEEEVVRNAFDLIRAPDFFSSDRIGAMVRALPRGRLSKFQPLLPPEIEARFLAERLFDVEGLQQWLRSTL